MPSTPSSSAKQGGTTTPPQPSSKSARTGTPALKHIADLIESGKVKDIVVLTGAGISTSAGIPDFRSPETGLYANLQALDLPFPEAVFELGYFKRNPKPFWTLAKEIYPGKHYPTPTHYFLHLLHRKGVLRRVFTQNIDTLEHLSGLPADKIIEAHGSFATAHCLSCGEETSTEYVLSAGVRKGEIVRCAEEGCEGLVKPDIVFFGEGLPDKFFEHMSDLNKCDLVIVIGTSLQVQPFSLLPDRAGPATPRLLINREAVGPFTSLETRSSGTNDHLARMLGRGGGRKGDLMWKGDADEGVRQLCVQLGLEKELDKVIRDGRERLERKWVSMEKASASAADLPEGQEDTGAEERTHTRAETTERGKAEEQRLVGETTDIRSAREETLISVKDDDDVDELQKAIEKDLRLGKDA